MASSGLARLASTPSSRRILAGLGIGRSLQIKFGQSIRFTDRAGFGGGDLGSSGSLRNGLCLGRHCFTWAHSICQIAIGKIGGPRNGVVWRYGRRDRYRIACHQRRQTIPQLQMVLDSEVLFRKSQVRHIDAQLSKHGVAIQQNTS